MRMNCLATRRSPSCYGARVRAQWVTFQVFRETGPCAIGGGETKIFAIKLENMAARGPAEPRCALDQNFENRLQIKRRSAYGLKNVGGRGLLLQGFKQLGEQSRILDGDDGLGGEVLQQFDLFFGERPNSRR